MQNSSWGVMMSSKIFKQSCKVQVQRFYQRDKTTWKSWSGLKLSSADGDWDIDLEQWLEYDQGYYCEIFMQPFEVQRFNQRDKQKADLAWSWAVHMEMGTLTMSWDWNVADVTAKTFKQSCLFHILIIDEATIVLLDSLTGSHRNRLEIKFLSEGLQIEWLTEDLPTWLIWLRNGIQLYCN